MTLFASGHSASGALRRSAVVASQTMSPCRASSRKASSASPAPLTASAEVKRKASKPSAFASAAILPFSVSAMTYYVGALVSKVEIGISPGRGEAGNAVLKQRPERRSRLQQRKPILDRLMLLPRHLAEIVERREVRRGREIGETHRVARKPAPRLGEMADIGEMIAQILAARPHRLHVGRGAARPEAPVDLFLDEIVGHLIVELAVEP